ncbi:hypothetical protein BLNAU_1182 [Blattamonas nauphoetae]|uniref:Uncharacterized protein n=1 Tax=Blattamonas nauphoetae TaxID=2049346 RepID=A0ABQ9YIM9_9EUKA|nr:hypothetical protein BLNAU_1182 [Blattamonas nauphoetae]
MTDISIDQSESSRRKPPESILSPTLTPSSSNILVNVCKFTLVSLNTLSTSGCIQLPPSVQAINATSLASIVSTFFESGDLVLLPNVTLDTIRLTLYERILQIDEHENPSFLFNPIFLAKATSYIVNASDLVSVVNSSPFLTDSDDIPSEELWRAANSVVTRSSLKHDVDSLFRFEEWVEVMTKSALLRLQSKYQHIAHHPHPSDQNSPNPLIVTSSEPTLDWNPTAPSIAIQSSFSFHSANLSNPNTGQSRLEDESERSDVSLNTRPPSNSSLSSVTFQQKALNILTILHSLITAPHSQSSATSNPAPLFHLLGQSDFSSISHQPLDLNEKFSNRIFFEEDETILTNHILRCHRLCKHVPPNQCIPNLRQFVDGLVGLLECQNKLLQHEVVLLLKTLLFTLEFGDIHRRLLDKLRYAFREGSSASQLVLLYVAVVCNAAMFENHKSLDDPLSDFDWDGLIHHNNLDDSAFRLSIILLGGEFWRHKSIAKKRASRLHSSLRLARIPSFIPAEPSIVQSPKPDTAEDSIFEQTILSSLDKSPLFLIVPLIGLHPLFFRGILPLHNELPLANLASVVASIIDSSTSSHTFELRQLFSVFPPPLVVHFFTRPICFIHSLDGLKHALLLFLFNLLPACAPFGECRSLAMIFREFSTVQPPNAQPDEVDLAVLQTVLDLHWLSIPPSFDSPLLPFASSNNHFSISSRDFNVPQSIFIHRFASDPLVLKLARQVKDVASLSVPSPAPALVSVVLEVMTRLVRVSSDGVRMELSRQIRQAQPPEYCEAVGGFE